MTRVLDQRENIAIQYLVTLLKQIEQCKKFFNKLKLLCLSYLNLRQFCVIARAFLNFIYGFVVLISCSPAVIRHVHAYVSQVATCKSRQKNKRKYQRNTQLAQLARIRTCCASVSPSHARRFRQRHLCPVVHQSISITPTACSIAPSLRTTNGQTI